MALAFILTASGSNGEQKLYIDHDDEKTVWMTIVGEYKGEKIQIDFNSLNNLQFQEFADYVNLVNNKVNPKKLNR